MNERLVIESLEKISTPPEFVDPVRRHFEQRVPTIKEQRFVESKQTDEITSSFETARAEVEAALARKLADIESERDRTLRALETEQAKAGSQSPDLAVETKGARAAALAAADCSFIQQSADPAATLALLDAWLTSGDVQATDRVVRVAETRLASLAREEEQKTGASANTVGPMFAAAVQASGKAAAWRATQTQQSPAARRAEIIRRHDLQALAIQQHAQRVRQTFQLDGPFTPNETNNAT